MSEVGHTLKPTGSLTMKEVPVWHATTRSLRTLPTNVDLSAIERTDSSALAWLLDLQSKAKKNQVLITFKNPSQALVTLAQLSGVQALLGWDSEASTIGKINPDESGS